MQGVGMSDKVRDSSIPPPACEACTDGASPLYPFTITFESKGWAPTWRAIWICGDCHHKLMFETGFLSD